MSFHAHPDDESLLTGGALAGWAARGHRVVIVTATAGEAGLSALHDGDDLARRRLAELDEAAARLGAARVVCLGFADSGFRGSPARDAFSRHDVESAARRLAAVLEEEGADVLTTYDQAGGYGHPDHVQVHRVGAAAAARAGTPRVLEATVEREALVRAARWLRVLPGLPPEFRPRVLADAYSPRSALTHCIDVRDQLSAKRAAMCAHSSQRGGGLRPRSLDLYLRLPPPVFAKVFGREWFVERGRTPRWPPASDLCLAVP